MSMGRVSIGNPSGVSICTVSFAVIRQSSQELGNCRELARLKRDDGRSVGISYDTGITEFAEMFG